jgi:hypothetical protein
MGSGGRTADRTLRGRVWAGVAVLSALCLLAGGGAARALRSAAGARTGHPRAAQPLSLRALGCFSSTACTAVGYVNTRSGGQVAERWDGSSWSRERIPAPRDSDVLRVSCPSASVCFAVGYASVLSRNGDVKHFIGLTERWDGTSWSRQSTPKVIDPTLDDVSCASPVACTIIGGTGLSGAGARPLAEHWDGTGWSTTWCPTSPARR